MSKLAAVAPADGLSSAGLGPAGGPSWHTVLTPLYMLFLVTTIGLMGKSGALSGGFFIVALPFSLFLIAMSHKRQFSAVPEPKLVARNFQFEYMPIPYSSAACNVASWQGYNTARVGEKGVWIDAPAKLIVGDKTSILAEQQPMWFDAEKWREQRQIIALDIAAGNVTRTFCAPERQRWLQEHTVPDELGTWPVVFSPLYAAVLLATIFWVYYPSMVRPLHQRSLVRGTDRARFEEPEHVAAGGPNADALAAGREPRQNMLRPVTVAGLKGHYSVPDVPPGVYWDELRLRWQSVHSDDFDPERAACDPLMPTLPYLDPRGELVRKPEPEPQTLDMVPAVEAAGASDSDDVVGAQPATTTLAPAGGAEARSGDETNRDHERAEKRHGGESFPAQQRRRSVVHAVLDATGLAPERNADNSAVSYAQDDHYMEHGRRRSVLKYHGTDLQAGANKQQDLNEVLMKPGSNVAVAARAQATTRGQAAFDVSEALDQGEV